MDFQIVTSTERDYIQVARAITKFNLAHLPPDSSDNMTTLGYVVKDSKGEVQGGVYGKILLGNMLSVDVLWVEEPCRDQDLGTKLMQKIEEAARFLKSRLSVVDTFDFQALEFYKKNGYSVFGVLDDCPCEGNKRYYLQKKL